MGIKALRRFEVDIGSIFAYLCLLLLVVKVLDNVFWILVWSDAVKIVLEVKIVLVVRYS